MLRCSGSRIVVKDSNMIRFAVNNFYVISGTCSCTYSIVAYGIVDVRCSPAAIVLEGNWRYALIITPIYSYGSVGNIT